MDIPITIVCAAFRPELLDRVWESVRNQTYKNWELIFVGDGVSGVVDWYKDFKYKKLTQGNYWFIDVERNRGHFGLYARNIGIMAAKNEYIVLHDDDNTWEPNHLESLVDLHIKTGKVPFCWMHIIGKKPGSTFQRIKRTDVSRTHIDLGCLLYKKEYFEKFGYFRPDAAVTFDANCIDRIRDGLGGKDAFACTNLPTLNFFHKRY